jgi:2-methylcitrate dehydratase PrpD
MGAAGGIRSARAAACGMTGPPTILEGKRGIIQAVSARPNPDALLDGLGTKWALMDTEVKPYTCCGLVISQVDGLRDLMKEHQVKAEEIDKITVGADQFSFSHVGSIGPRPKTIVEAQFSTHFSLAMSAVLGANDFSTYHAMAKDNFTHAEVCDLASRVEVVLDPELEARYPDISKSKVTVVTKEGRKLHGDGFGYRSLSQDEVERKFCDLVGGTLTGDQARGVMETVANLETIENVTGLAALLVRGKLKDKAPVEEAIV